MQRLEFIEKVFTLFRKNPESNADLIRIYDDAFSTRKPVDWDKLYKMTVADADSISLPMPQWFTSKFDYCLKDVNYATPDGIKIKVLLKDGYPYEFETYKCSLSLEEIKQRFMRKFGDNFGSMSVYWESDNPDALEYEWQTV